MNLFYKIKEIITGIVIGFLIILGLHFFLLSLDIDLSINFSSVNDKPFWILLSFIIFIGILYYQLKKKVDTNFNKISNTLENEKNKSVHIINFLKEIIKGNYNYIVKQKSEGKSIGNLLYDFQKELNKEKEKENSRIEEDKLRNWTTSGLAEFGELLRKDNDNIEKLSSNILNHLVKYVKAKQGSIFLINDNNNKEKYLEQTACFACDKKKKLNKRISWGEGLVGSCAIESKTILLTDIPKNYFTITSGLGEIIPSCLLIVPLSFNDKIVGVIELASFKTFEKFEISFIETIAERVASTVISSKIHIETSLLLEKSRQQSEDLAQKEEELNINLDELRLTRDNAIKQGEEFELFTNAVNRTMILAEYNVKGELIYASTRFIDKLAYENSTEILGKSVLTFIDDIDKKDFEKDWISLAKGGTHFEGDVKHTKKDGTDIWMTATYVCQRKSDNTVDKILFLGTDITENKEKNLDSSAQIEAINLSSMKAEFDQDGNFIICNDQFLSTLNYEQSLINDKDITDLIPEAQISEFEEVWKSILEGNPYKGIIQFIDYNGNNKWFQGAASTLKDYYGNIKKVIYVATDISERKIMELKLKDSEENLKIKLNIAKEELKVYFKDIEQEKVRNELILEGMLDAILSIDDKGIITFFNKAAEELWNYTKEEVINKDISILFSDLTIEKDDFVAAFVNPNNEKYISVRQEVSISTKSLEETSVLILISEANLNNKKTYTAFVQNIEMELF